jgi:hypothetical protein
VGGLSAPSSVVSNLFGKAHVSNAAPTSSKNDFIMGFHIQRRPVGNPSALRGTFERLS